MQISSTYALHSFSINICKATLHVSPTEYIPISIKHMIKSRKRFMTLMIPIALINLYHSFD